MKAYFCLLLAFTLCSCKTKTANSPTPQTVDSHGGLRITLTLLDNNLANSTVNSITQTLQTRVAFFYEDNPSVRRASNNIIIDLPLQTDTALFKEVLLTNRSLQVFEAYFNRDFRNRLLNVNEMVLTHSKLNLPDVDSTGKPSGSTLLEILNQSQSIEGNSAITAAIGYCLPEDTVLVNEILSDSAVNTYLDNKVRFYWSSDTFKSHHILYAIKKPVDYKPIVSEMIENTWVSAHSVFGRTEFGFILKPEYHKEWERITSRNVNKFLAIVIDGKVVSCPMVQAPIKVGRSTIIGTFSTKQAKLLAASILPGIDNNKLTIDKIEVINRP